mmetsp:Transcript_22535/g.36542  ORF Transcript_22535/g.36542 Transcript_22535/m.36542 type:complete len:303 (-) Transcript_22535:531-1439(-)
MGIVTGHRRRRHGRVNDHTGASRAQPRVSHRQPVRLPCFHLARGQRMIQPPFLPAPAAMKPGQPAIGMAQSAQRRCNPLDRVQMRRRCGPLGIAQRGRGPGEQGKHIQQFFRIAGGQPPFIIDLVGAFLRQGRNRRRGQIVHPLKRQARIDQPRQRFEPGQTRGRRMPAFGQEHGLLGEGLVKGVGLRHFGPAQHKESVVDPPDQPPPRQVRRPARAAPLAIAVDPAPQPALPRLSGRCITHGSQIIHPAKAMQRLKKCGVRRLHVPQFNARSFDQSARKQIVACHQLPPAGETANGARFGG